MSRRRLSQSCAVALVVSALLFVGCGPQGTPQGDGPPDPDDGGDAPTGTLYLSRDGDANGLYVLDMTTGEATPVGEGITGVTSYNVGLAGRGAGEPMVGSTWSTLVDVALDGSGVTPFGVLDASAQGMTYLHDLGAVVTSRFYDLTFTRDSEPFDVLDVFEAPWVFDALAADEEAGVIYAVGEVSELYAFDLVSETWSVVFDTGRVWDSSGLAFDHDAGVLYAIYADGGPTLYRIDPVAESIVEVGDSGLVSATNQGGGLAWVPDGD